MMIPDFKEIRGTVPEIYHYGIPERSGRYKWGSGDRPYQRLEGAKGKVRDFVKGTNYEKKEIGRLRTGIELAGRSAIISALSSIGGVAVGLGTQNYIAGMAAYNALATGLLLSPIGKINVYFKKSEEKKVR